MNEERGSGNSKRNEERNGEKSGRVEKDGINYCKRYF